MYTSLHISTDRSTAIMLRSHHKRSHKKTTTDPTDESTPEDQPIQTRDESQFNTKSYNDGLQRAFNKAKMDIFFNPDMQYFVTLTYAKNMQNLDQALHDVKMLIQKTNRRLADSCPAGSGRKTKYIFVFEYQKRGALHVHMIADNSFLLHVNKNGYNSLTDWTHGYSSILHVNDLDQNFRPYLYLFKYMKKAQRIGKSFLHSSRNLKNYEQNNDYQLHLDQWTTVNMEYTETTIESTHFQFYKNYLKKYDTIDSQH